MKEAAETLVPKSLASCGSIGSTQRSEIPELNAASARSTMASRELASLGRKPLDLPRRAVPPIEQPVVQPVGAPLPELDLAGQHAVAAPVRRARWRIAVAAARLVHGIFEDCPGRHALALRGRPGGKARAERAAGEIGVGIPGV